MDLMTTSDVKLEAKVATGAQANIMPVHVYDKIIKTRSHLRPSTAHLQGYGGQILQNEGIATIKCRTSASNLKFHFTSSRKVYPYTRSEVKLYIQLN